MNFKYWNSNPDKIAKFWAVKALFFCRKTQRKVQQFISKIKWNPESHQNEITFAHCDGGNKNKKKKKKRRGKRNKYLQRKRREMKIFQLVLCIYKQQWHRNEE